MADYDDVIEALRRADAAGNTDDARRLAEIAASMRPQAAQAPQGEEPTYNHRALPGGTRGIRQEPVTGLSRRMMRGVLGAVRGGMDVMEGGAQLGLNTAEATIPAGLSAVGAPETGTAVGEFLRRAIAEEDALRHSNEAYYQKNWREGVTGTDVGRLAGNVAASIPIAAAMPASLPGAILAGGLTSAMMPTEAGSKGEYWQKKASDAAIGAGTAGATNLAMRGLARVISPKASRPGDVKTLYDQGVVPTPGQVLGGTAQRVEEGLTSIPGIGDVIKAGQLRSVKSLNKAAINKALAPIGEKLDDATEMGRPAVREMGDKIDAVWTKLLPKIVIKADDVFEADIAKLQSMAQFMPEERAKQFGEILDKQVLRRFNPETKTVSGTEFKKAEETLGKMARDYMRAQDPDQRTLGTALNEVLFAARRAAERNNPEFAKTLAGVNKSYGLSVRIYDAAGRAPSNEGVFSAAALQSAVKRGDKTLYDRAFAQGKAVMQDLSEPARNVLGQTVPDSGTPFRIWATGGAPAAAYAAGLLSPQAAAAAALGLAPYTPLGQRAFAASMMSRPEFAQPLAESVKAAGPYVGAGAAGISKRGLFDLLGIQP